MANISAISLEPWQIERILGFFNRVRSLTEITDGLLKDDPDLGKGNYVIGDRVAARILDRRNRLPERKFSDIGQLDHIPGLGQDKIADIIYTLGRTASSTFRAKMEEIAGPSWQILDHSIRIEDPDQFRRVVEDESAFTEIVAAVAVRIAEERSLHPKPEKAIRKEFQETRLEAFENGHIGAHALALWFYRFDADNWFTFDEVLEVTEPYLDFFPTFDRRSELRLFKGFQNTGLLAVGVTVKDLPVVVNYAEQRITLWTTGLLD